jgi:hypothetical protein
LVAVIPGVALQTAHAQTGTTVYEAKMISSGRNFPSVDINQDGFIPLCVALHKRLPLDTIREQQGWTEGDLAWRIERLKRAGLVSQSPSGRLTPSFMVIGLDDAKQYLPVSADLVTRTSSLISKQLPKIIRMMNEISELRAKVHHTAMFFVLSDVLLDNWQINNVEHSVLGSARPLRDGNRFYLALFEKSVDEQTEAFGIYGNGGAVRAGIQVNAYGNQRYGGHTLISASNADLARWFPDLPSQDIERALLSRLIEIGRNGSLSAAKKDLKEGLNQFGLVDRDELNLLIFSEQSLDHLASIASIITPDLEALLRGHLPALETAYGNSPYKDEITFNEYFIWWYHFFYTQVTNNLAARHLLRIPVSGNVTYIIQN